LPSLRPFILDRLRDQAPTPLIALAWLVPLLYPFSLQALFNSAQVAHESVAGVTLVALALTWVFAGPFVAVYALNHKTVNHFERRSTRMLLVGALMATMSPALFIVVSRAMPGLAWWYVAVALVSLTAVLRWPTSKRSTARFLYVHRLSGLVLAVFVSAHVINQALAFFSLSSYAAMRSVMRVASQQPALYALVVGAVAIQIGTGAAIGMKKVRVGSRAANLQAVSGWYLAAFLLTHVFSGFLFSHLPVTTAVAPSATQFDLLASARSTAQLPYLLLGVSAFLFHIGLYGRLAALAHLAESSVRRLSYAAMFAATTVVVAVGLALCGIHLVR
jgi:succinate dehydrogenase/fumarate reductase cytochrome b subunit